MIGKCDDCGYGGVGLETVRYTGLCAACRFFYACANRRAFLWTALRERLRRWFR